MLCPATSNESVVPEAVCLPVGANGMTVSDAEARPNASESLIANLTVIHYPALIYVNRVIQSAQSLEPVDKCLELTFRPQVTNLQRRGACHSRLPKADLSACREMCWL